MKKVLALILIFALALTVLAGCGGGSGGGSGSNSSGSSSSANSSNSSSSSSSSSGSSTGSGSSSSSSNTASADPGKIEYDEVIWDGEGMKITLTGFQRRELWEDYAFYLTIENNTDKDIMTRFEHAAVNGCMITWTNYTENNKTKAGETRDDTKLTFGIDYLKERGITEIQEVEFSLQFFEDVIPYVTPLFGSEPITISGPADSGNVQKFDVDGAVAVDENGIKITVTDLEITTIEGLDHYIHVFVENNSGEDIYVSGGGGGGDLLVCDVLDGKVALTAISYSTVNIPPAERAEYLTNKDGVILAFSVSYMEDHGTDIVYENPITVKFDSSGKLIK